MHRIGLVGCGGIARSHIEGYRQATADVARVAAACDCDATAVARFADTYEVPLRFTDPQAMMASGEVDVVSVLTPAGVRHEVVAPACEHGVHLLVEKPFAASLVEAREQVALADRAGITMAVNQQFRFMPEAVLAKRSIAEGELGELRHLSHDVFQRRLDVRGWRKDESRLEISIYSIHLLDRLRWLAGSAVEAVSAVTRHWNPDTRGETYTALTMQFAGGAVATMVSIWHALQLNESQLRLTALAARWWGGVRSRSAIAVT